MSEQVLTVPGRAMSAFLMHPERVPLPSPFYQGGN